MGEFTLPTQHPRSICMAGGVVVLAAIWRTNQAGSELDVEGGVQRTGGAGYTHAPGDAGAAHGHALAGVGAAQWQGVEAVEQVVDAHVHAEPFVLIAGAQVEQAVAGGFGFVAHGGDFGFGAHGLPFCGAGPLPQRVYQCQLGVERHDVVQVVAGSQIFTSGVAELGGGIEAAIAGGFGQLQLAADVHAV